MIGRDIHLPVAPGFTPPGNPTSEPYPAARGAPTPHAAVPMPRSAIPSHLDEEATAELPSRSPKPQGQSRLARFIGRWTESGRFVSESRGPGRGADDKLEIPRDPLARNVVLVLAVALLTFLLTLFGVKARQHFTSKPTSPSAPAATAAQKPPQLGR